MVFTQSPFGDIFGMVPTASPLYNQFRYQNIFASVAAMTPHMTSYLCSRCRLTIYVGFRLAWTCDSAESQFVCRDCGTMTRVDYADNEPDTFSTAGAPLPFDGSDLDSEYFLQIEW